MAEEEGFYQSYSRRRNSWAKGLETDPNRFVPMKQRRDSTVFPPDTLKAMQRGKYLTYWQGIEMIKASLDTTIYQMMLWAIKPATVLEIGAYRGGSALWLADHLRMFDISGHVYSLDIDLSLLDERVKGREGITFIEGDCHRIEDSFPSKMLQKLPHPWIIIEDAHANVEYILDHLNRHMKTGDYLIVEDTTLEPNFPGVLEFDETVAPFGPNKMKILRRFAEKHGEELKVDTYYTDLFGYNGTWNINGILRKM